LVRVLAKDLVKVFNGNRRWQATELNCGEASNIAIAISSLRLEGTGPMERFIADIGDIIRANLKEASNVDLVNLAKSTHYMRNFDHTKDLYSHVHAECVSRFNLRQLESETKELLTKVFSSHGIMTNSPFSQGGSGGNRADNVRVTR